MATTDNASFAFIKEFAEKVSAGTIDLPACPEIAVKVQKALGDPNTSVDVVARLAMMDPVFTAKLLRLANSALLHRGTMEVTDLKLAISRIGFDMVRNLVFDVGINKAFALPAGSRLKSLNTEIRAHSHKVSVLSFLLTKRLALPAKPEDAMLAGLLHDIGKLYILTKVEDYPELFADKETFACLLKEWHPGIGRAVVDSWGFPESFSVAVEAHQELAREHVSGVDLADIVLIANVLSHLDEPEYAEKLTKEQIPVMDAMNLDEAKWTAFVEQTKDVIDAFGSSLAD